MISSFVPENLEINSKFLYSNQFDLSSFVYSITPQSRLSCICIKLNEEATLDKHWERITNEIAIEFISNLNDSFSKWNCYLIFICPKPVSKEIKYKIENDKFAIRKIVIDDVKEQLTEDGISKLLNERILSSNIRLAQNMTSNSKGDVSLSDVANRVLNVDIPLDASDNSIKQRKSWIGEEIERIRINENQTS
ncbi:hypothetical protein O1D97_12485 [Marinomonas sp. 15G1-11]|uniref:Uncharacterized protein n=1 Tax=Marinomonas phaeophyticola TaxID=3004091 RepID=A0ABT4JWG2_9GAMM|nr:ABC-three component system middle component 1 [Marinomonas sp. 15G1-11]MCZ2722417.1 hypothetical protein [Marinomonas sp. 15G1-11]